MIPVSATGTMTSTARSWTWLSDSVLYGCCGATRLHSRKVPYIGHFSWLGPFACWQRAKGSFHSNFAPNSISGERVILADLSCLENWSLSKRASLLGIPVSNNQPVGYHHSILIFTKGHLWFPLWPSVVKPGNPVESSTSCPMVTR